MGLFEDIAIFDLKYRLVLGAAVVVWSITYVIVGSKFDSTGAGAALGVILGIVGGYLMYRMLP